MPKSSTESDGVPAASKKQKGFITPFETYVSEHK